MAVCYTPQVTGTHQYLWLQQDHHSPEALPGAFSWPPRCGCTGEQRNSLLSHPDVSSRAVKNLRSFQANNNSKNKHSSEGNAVKYVQKALRVNVSKLPLGVCFPESSREDVNPVLKGRKGCGHETASNSPSPQLPCVLCF